MHNPSSVAPELQHSPWHARLTYCGATASMSLLACMHDSPSVLPGLQHFSWHSLAVLAWLEQQPSHAPPDVPCLALQQTAAAAAADHSIV